MEEEEGEEEDPEEAFIRRLKEYKIYKAAGEELNDLYEQARRRYARLPEELPPRLCLDILRAYSVAESRRFDNECAWLLLFDRLNRYAIRAVLS